MALLIRCLYKELDTHSFAISLFGCLSPVRAMDKREGGDDLPTVIDRRVCCDKICSREILERIWRERFEDCLVFEKNNLWSIVLGSSGLFAGVGYLVF